MIRSRGVVLRPIQRSDYDELRRAEISASIDGRSRLSGATPSVEEYPALLSHDVLAQFLVCFSSSGRVTGLVSAYAHDGRNGVASIAAVSFGEAQRSPTVMYGAALFIDWLFTTRPLRKLRIETPEWHESSFASLVTAGLARREGCLEGEVFHDGRCWDVVNLAIWRDDWIGHRERYLGPPTHR